MKSIRMTIDEALLDEVDKMVQQLRTNRSAFIRSALRMAPRQHTISRLEQQHAEGYARYPVTADEFDIWESEQVWEKQ